MTTVYEVRLTDEAAERLITRTGGRLLPDGSWAWPRGPIAGTCDLPVAVAHAVYIIGAGGHILGEVAS